MINYEVNFQMDIHLRKLSIFNATINKRINVIFNDCDCLTYYRVHHVQCLTSVHLISLDKKLQLNETIFDVYKLCNIN